jgi:DnaJ family protein B protein 13
LTKFNAICEAYEVLGNERLKAIYDTKGHLSLSNGFTADGEEFIGYAFSGNAFKIFKNFFGSDNPWSQQLAPQSQLMDEVVKLGVEAKAQDVEVTVECSLFEFYNGAIKDVAYQR